MKTKSNDLQALVLGLQQQSIEKKDFVIPSSHIRMRDGKIVFSINGNPEMKNMLEGAGIGSGNMGEDETYSLAPNAIFHEHLREKLSIPKLYYDRINTPAHLKMLDTNVNYWLALAKTNFLVRTFINPDTKEGMARALLSDRFKCIDNYDILFAALEAIKASGVKVDLDGDISDKRIYLRFTAPEVIKQSPALLKNYKVSRDNNDFGVLGGFIISNSETGFGSFTVAPRIVISACTNGMIHTSEQFRKTHLGGKIETYSTIEWSEETRQKELELIMNQVRDAVRNFLTETYLGGIIETLEGKNLELKNPAEAVNNVSAYLKMSDEKKTNLLNYFMRNGDTSTFGLVNSVTEFAQEEKPDDRYDLEIVSFELIEKMPQFDIASKN